MHHLVRKNIAIDTEMLPTHRTLIPRTARLHQAPRPGRPTTIDLPCPLLPRRDIRKRPQASKARTRPPRVGPRDIGPVDQREEVVVAAGEMCGEDQGEVAGRAFGGQGANFRRAA